MNYNTYIPDDIISRNVIHSIWQVDHYTPFKVEYIIPKGIVEVIFNFSGTDRLVAAVNDFRSPLPNCFINGFNTVPIQVQLPEHQVFFGVLFQPLAIRKIFKSHASEFADTAVDLTLVDPGFRTLWHLLAEQVNFQGRVAIFQQWSRANFIEWKPQEQLINRFLYAANQHDWSVVELAKSLCYSPRQLSRKILEATGLNTEELLLYKRYLHAVHLVHHTDLSLTAIAYQSQFSDQSHFIRTFKAFTRLTPGEYRRSKSGVKGHIYKDVR